MSALQSGPSTIESAFSSDRADSSGGQNYRRQHKRRKRAEVPDASAPENYAPPAPGNNTSVAKNQRSRQLANPHPNNGQHKGEAKKKRTKKRSSVNINHISSLEVNLNDFADDVVSIEKGAKSEESLNNALNKHSLTSQPTGKLFIEQTGGFKSADKKKVARDLWEHERKQKEDDSEDEVLFPVKMTSMNFAFQTQHVFRTFVTFCMGVVAGLTIAQTVLVYVATYGDYDYKSFLSSYSSLSLPVNCVFYILLVLCTVATFDRYDIAKPSKKFLKEAVTLQSGAIAMVLFLSALSFNLGIASSEDKMSPHLNSTTLWPNDIEAKYEIDSWKILCIVRSALTALGWFMISLKPGTNRLRTNLQLTEIAWVDKDESAVRMKSAHKASRKSHT